MAKVPTTKLILRKKTAKDTEGYIKIAVYLPGQNNPLLKSTKYKINEKYWSADHEAASTKWPDYQIFNREIHRDRDRLISRFKKDLEAGLSFTKEHVMNRLNGPDDDFLTFYRAYIDNLIKTKKREKSTIAQWETEYKMLKEYAGDALPFSNVTADFLNRYHAHLVLKDYEHSTIFKKLKRVRRIINLAIGSELIKRSQISNFEMIKWVDPDTHYCTMAMTEKLWKSIKDGDLSQPEGLHQTACYFLIACYSGIRFSDWHRFEVEKLVFERHLKVRAKKNGEPVYISLDAFKRLSEIIDYVTTKKIRFTTNAKDANDYLKGIGAVIGAKWGLSTHDGRRTCATLLGEIGYTDNEIAEVLGIEPRQARKYTKRTRQGLTNTFASKGGL